MPASAPISDGSHLLGTWARGKDDSRTIVIERNGASLIVGGREFNPFNGKQPTRSMPALLHADVVAARNDMGAVLYAVDAKTGLLVDGSQEYRCVE